MRLANPAESRQAGASQARASGRPMFLNTFRAMEMRPASLEGRPRQGSVQGSSECPARRCSKTWDGRSPWPGTLLPAGIPPDSQGATVSFAVPDKKALLVTQRNELYYLQEGY